MDARMTMRALAQNQLANPIIWVRDGEECLDYLHGRGSYLSKPAPRVALVLIDIHMPRMNGLELLQALRADPGTTRIPAVILSTSSQHQDVAEGYGKGINAYVVKPVRFAEFMDAVGRLGMFWGVLNRSV